MDKRSFRTSKRGILWYGRGLNPLHLGTIVKRSTNVGKFLMYARTI